MQTNISDILRVNLTGLKTLSADTVLRAVASAVLPAIRKRVHIDGKDSSGAQIGTYSAAYMKVRTGNYSDAAKFSRGPNKGKFKERKLQYKGEAGKRSKGNYKGAPRRVYNRSADTKVVASLTRQMENDLSVIGTPSGYGIGYKNPHNYDKSQWVEGTYGKRIWGMTSDEEKLAIAVAEDYVKKDLTA